MDVYILKVLYKRLDNNLFNILYEFDVKEESDLLRFVYIVLTRSDLRPQLTDEMRQIILTKEELELLHSTNNVDKNKMLQMVIIMMNSKKYNTTIEYILQSFTPEDWISLNNLDIFSILLSYNNRVFDLILPNVDLNNDVVTCAIFGKFHSDIKLLLRLTTYPEEIIPNVDDIEHCNLFLNNALEHTC